MWKKLKFETAKLFYPYIFFWWRVWSTIYRFLYHRKYKKVVLPRDLTYIEANDALSGLTYRPDRFIQLWDVVGSPRYVQHCINTGDTSSAMDCDEFACWAANTIHAKFDPRIFCFSWYDERQNKLSGHAMCWVRTKDGKYHHVGNWGLYGPYNNLHEACQKIISPSMDYKAVGWVLLDKELSLLSSGRGLPSKKTS
jgi:hypothetical protein